MKNIKKIFVLLISLLLFTNGVNALLEDNSCITIDEKAINQWDAGFDTTMHICTYKKMPTGWKVVEDLDINRDKDTPEEAWKLGVDELKKLDYYTESLDGKGQVHVNAMVPVCANKVRMIQVKGTCRAKVNPKFPSDAFYSSEKTYYDEGYDCSQHNGRQLACENDPFGCSWSGRGATGTCSGGRSAGTKCENGANPSNNCCTSGVHVGKNRCCATSNYNAAADNCCPAGYPVFDLDTNTCCPPGYKYETSGPDAPAGAGCYYKKENVRYMYEYIGDGETEPSGADGENRNKNKYYGIAQLNKAWKEEKKDHIPTSAQYLPKGEDYSQMAATTTPVWYGCDKDTIKFDLTCPFYKCNDTVAQVDACVPTFSAGGKEAYCLNPSMPYTTSYKAIPFDITQCTDSAQSQDCGYANIMIEGKCTGASETAKYLAVRLWAKYYNGLGFGEMDPVKTGLANVVSLIHDYDEKDTGKCSKQVYYLRQGGKHVNVYQVTFDLISKYFSRALNKNSGWDNYASIHIDHISCGAIGLACDAHHDVVDRAVKLVLNTIAGNKHMLQHMRDCNDNSETDTMAIPTRVQLVDAPEGEPPKNKWILVSYSSEYTEVFGDVERINCDTWEDGDGNKISEELRKDIEPYCTRESRILGPGGIIVEDPKWCRKNTGCYYETKATTICEKNTQETTIKEVWVKYGDYVDSFDMRRYVACGGVGADGNQMMLVFDDSGGGDKTDDETETRWKHFSVDSYQCIKGGCDNVDLRVSENFKAGEAKCAADTKESYEASVKDPSLSCIVNLPGGDGGERSKYDYSAAFGVNTDFCRIYCSDSVTYHLAGKQTIYSGRPFKYDLRDGKFFGHDVDKNIKLSAVLTEKRSCVSEIFYEDQYLPTSVDWNARYGLEGSGNTYTWRSLVSAIQSHGNATGRVDTLRTLLFDLYNCNLYKRCTRGSGDCSEEGVIPKALVKNTNYVNAQEKIISTFSKNNNYNIERVPGNDFSNFADKVNYEFGSNIVVYDEGDGVTRHPSEVKVTNDSGKAATVGDGANSVVNSKVVKDGLPLKTDAENIKVSYCQNGDKTPCLKWETPTKDNPEDYTYQKLKDGTNKTSGYINLDGQRIPIPVNDYAFFEVTAEFDFFNDNLYQTLNDTGNVVKPGTPASSSLVTLDKYSYPTNKYAHNNSSCVVGEDGTASCPVTQTIKAGTFNRNVTVKVDKLKEFLGTEKKFTCSINVLPTDTGCSDSRNGGCKNTEFIYRNVDVSSLFPWQSTKAKNWNSERGQYVKERIEATYDVLRTTENLLEYRIVLTPEQIRAIKEDFSGQSYVNEPTYNCDETYVEKGLYLDCKSEFLDILRGTYDPTNKTRYGTLGTPDGRFTSGVSACNDPNNASLGCSTKYVEKTN